MSARSTALRANGCIPIPFPKTGTPLTSRPALRYVCLNRVPYSVAWVGVRSWSELR